MAWCRQAPSHYLGQCWPRTPTSYGVTRPQWVKTRKNGQIFADGTFNRTTLKGNCVTWLESHWSLFLREQMTNGPALVEVIAWHGAGDKLLSKAMMIQFTDVYMRQKALMSYLTVPNWLGLFLWHCPQLNANGLVYDQPILVQTPSHYPNQRWPNPIVPRGVTSSQWHLMLCIIEYNVSDRTVNISLPDGSDFSSRKSQELFLELKV